MCNFELKRLTLLMYTDSQKGICEYLFQYLDIPLYSLTARQFNHFLANYIESGREQIDIDRSINLKSDRKNDK